MGALTIGLSSTESASATLLRHADRSPAVTQLQQGLTAAGYYQGPVTGYYGDLTQAAVRRFQQAQGLIVDGIAGPQTLAALQRVAPGYQFFTQSTTPQPSPSPSNPTVTPPVNIPAEGLSIGSTGTAVTQLQVQLTQAGYYAGPITDYFGPRTQDAVLRFQQARGLPQTGVADSQTLRALANVAPMPTASTPNRRPFEVTPSQPGGSTGVGNPSSAARPGAPSSGVASFNPAGTGSLADSAPVGTLLYRGDRGPEVRQLQESLTQLGVYRGPITGYYGSLTENAVYRFQQLNKIEPTGVAGPVTRQQIQSSIQPI